MAESTSKKPESVPQDSGEYEVGYKKPPQTEASKKTRFGGEKGNPRGHGFFKVEDTPRAKLEQILKLPDEDLREIKKNPSSPSFEKRVAEVMLDPDLKPSEKWRVLKEMIDEVYGQPKVVQENHNIEYKPLVDLTKRKKNGAD